MNRRTRFTILERDGFTCQCCGRGAPDVALQVDHIHPQSLGGRDDPENLRTTCFDCNQGKGALEPAASDYRRWQHERDERIRATYLLCGMVLGWAEMDGVAEIDLLKATTARITPTRIALTVDEMAEAVAETARWMHGAGPRRPRAWDHFVALCSARLAAKVRATMELC